MSATASGGADATATTRAVADLRRRTLGRAARGYAVWVGRAVGWWTIAYLAFWFVVFGISAIESLPTLDPPLPPVVPVALGGLAALAFAPLVLAGRAPPVALDRRDLYRLALSAAPPYAVLRWRLRARRLAAAAVGAVAGGAWSVLAPALTGSSAPWAAPALALAAAAWADLGWVRYAAYRRPEDGGAARRDAVGLVGLALAGGAAGAGLGVALGPGWAVVGPAGALASASPLALVVPALLAIAAQAAVRRSLATSWPPRFAPQSLVLSQLQAMRTFQWIARAAGLPMRGEADAFVRDRLLAALHDRPDAVRPRRSLRPPPATAPRWRALAWRAASAWVRRRTWPRLASLTTTLAAAAAGVGVGGTAAGLWPSATPQTGFVAPGDAFGQGVLVAAGVFGAAWLAARAWGPWLGPSLPAGTLPVEPGTRTAGRLAVGGAALGVGIVLAVAGGTLAGLAPSAAATLAAAILLATVGIVLEKYGAWSGVGASGWEAQLVAALVAAAPTMLAAAFGVPGLAPVGSALVLAIAWVLPV